MALQAIREGFDVFVCDGEKAFGAVRHVAPDGQAIVIYVEGAGDFPVPLSAIADVHSGKVILERGKIDAALGRAIDHAHEREDPSL